MCSTGWLEAVIVGLATTGLDFLVCSADVTRVFPRSGVGESNVKDRENFSESGNFAMGGHGKSVFSRRSVCIL